MTRVNRSSNTASSCAGEIRKGVGEVTASNVQYASCPGEDGSSRVSDRTVLESACSHVDVAFAVLKDRPPEEKALLRMKVQCEMDILHPALVAIAPPSPVESSAAV